jgi:hypothetical protein
LTEWKRSSIWENSNEITKQDNLNLDGFIRPTTASGTMARYSFIPLYTRHPRVAESFQAIRYSRSSE